MPTRILSGGAPPPGFTLIELLLVIGATGILGALAASAYRTYAVRAEIADGIQTTVPWQRFVEQAFQSTGEAPTTAVLPGSSVGAQSDYVRSIEVIDGRLDLTYGHRAHAAIAGRHLSLTPYETASQEVIWICGQEIPGPGLQPLGFAGGGRQAIQVATTIEARYLPATCR